MSLADPLDGVDGVPWHELYGCGGRSTGVPDLLRALRGADRPAGDVAFLELFDHLYHQGTRWQVSASTVPYLVALVEDPTTPGRAGVLGMLAAVAVGDRRDDALPFDADRAYAEAGNITDEQSARLARWLHGDDDGPADAGADNNGAADAGADNDGAADAGPDNNGPADAGPDSFGPVGDGSGDEDFYWDNSGPDRWARDAYRAAARHVDTIAGWVSDADADVAVHAAALLAWFAPSPRSLDALVAAPDGPVRASANLALAHLPTADPRVEGRLRGLLAGPDERVTLTAAIALAYRSGAALGEPALSMLVAAADHGRPLPADVPGWDRRALRGFVALALQRIGR